MIIYVYGFILFIIIPLLSYSNADTAKQVIIKEIKGKAGIYRWINNNNGKSYVGSSVDLSKRLYRYYSLAHITQQSKFSLICKALLKRGYSCFTFEILEYCNKEDVLIREQYYLDLLKPEYNILKVAGSPLGYKHAEEDKEKMRGPRSLSPEHLAKIKSHISKLNAKKAISFIVNDLEKNTLTEFSSLRAAARELHIAEVSIKKYLNNSKLFKNRYIFTKVNK